MRYLCVVISTVGLLGCLAGCGQTSSRNEDNASKSSQEDGKPPPPAPSRSPTAAPPSLTFVVPTEVENTFKRKCYICHGGAEEVKGGVNLKKMVYKPDKESEWQSMDLAGATRIKLAILPIDGKKPKMPKKAGSTFNPLTEDEMNTIAKWTDYPFKR